MELNSRLVAGIMPNSMRSTSKPNIPHNNACALVYLAIRYRRKKECLADPTYRQLVPHYPLLPIPGPASVDQMRPDDRFSLILTMVVSIQRSSRLWLWSRLVSSNSPSGSDISFVPLEPIAKSQSRPNIDDSLPPSYIRTSQTN